MKEGDKCLGGCAEFAKWQGLEPECCDSCHDDANEGYGDLIDFPAPGGYYWICCRMLDKYEDVKGPIGH